MYKKVLGLTLLLMVFLYSCTPIVSMKSEDIISYKEELMSSNKVVHDLEVEFFRPRLNWKVYINKDIQDIELEKLFNSIVDFMKSEDRHKEWRKGRYFIYMNIIFYDIKDNSMIREYNGTYYKPGTTIYDDDKNNEIDNYTTWHFKDYKTSETGVYNYSE